MARGRKRVVEATAASITESIKSVDEKINALNEEIKTLRIQKKELIKDLAVAEKREAEEKEAESMKNIIAMIQERGLSIDDVQKILDANK